MSTNIFKIFQDIAIQTVLLLNFAIEILWSLWDEFWQMFFYKTLTNV